MSKDRSSDVALPIGRDRDYWVVSDYATMPRHEQYVLLMLATPCKYCKAVPGEPCVTSTRDKTPYPVGTFHSGGRM